MQGEERDSSDEEWASAYVAMDPVSQMGFRNRRSSVRGPGEHLMRDIMEAADALHSDAMSEMDETIQHIDEGVANANLDVVGCSPPPPADDCRSPTSSVEVDQEGA